VGVVGQFTFAQCSLCASPLGSETLENRTMPTLHVTGWHKGLKAVSLTQLIHTELGLGLSAAKEATEGLLAGRPQSFQIDSSQDPASLVRRLRDLGADAAVADAA
jgi:hypothetical protein